MCWVGLSLPSIRLPPKEVPGNGNSLAPPPPPPPVSHPDPILDPSTVLGSFFCWHEVIWCPMVSARLKPTTYHNFYRNKNLKTIQKKLNFDLSALTWNEKNVTFKVTCCVFGIFFVFLQTFSAENANCC